MTITPPLRRRPLTPGRGRVYPIQPGMWWADYRSPEGSKYCAWAESPAEAADWIRSKAKEATK